MRRFLLVVASLTVLLLTANHKASATHLMGGEITWECNGNGEYVFTFKVYRDCSGNIVSPNQSGLIQIHNYPTVNSVTQIPPSQWTTVTDSDISPDCAGAGSFSCANRDPESVFEYVRTFTRRLNGTPPPQGWIITYDDVARNANDNLVGQPGLTLRAKILPYPGQVADSCKDNSPQFRELATSLICTGIPFKYNHNATDDELDSLVYEWARPLNAIGTNQLYVEGSVPAALSFQSGYTFNSPFPGITQDVRNVPATIDRNTGEISLTSFTSGKFVSCVKVTAYKCGVPVAEIYRELQSNLSTSSVCSSNNKPVIRPPFQDPSNNFTLWNDTVRAGDLVQFNIQIQDFASISQNGGDSVTLLASGLQFGDNFTSSTTGCINPPCATLTNTLPQTGFVGVSTAFSWQTDCNHTSFTDLCVSGQNTYTFVITAIDNRCPLPLKNVGTISITVLADSVLLSPIIHCADVQPNGDVTLEWNTTPNVNNSFSAWMLYSSTNVNGPFTLVDSIKTYNTTTYTHTGANAQNERRYYFLRSRSGCKGIVQNVARDTIATMFIDPITNPSNVSVNWNPLSTPNPNGSSSNYRFFREYPIGSGLNFLQNVNTETFSDNIANCTDSVRYRVDLINPLEGCTSRSNTVLYQVQFPQPIADFTYPLTACPGNVVTFTNTSTISGGAVSYRWNFGDGSPTSTQTNPAHSYSAIGTYTIQLIASTPKGCADTISKTIDITLPTADAGADQTICPSGSVQIGGSPTTTSPTPTFAWSPAASLNNATIANPTASPTNTTTYTVTVTDVNGCTNTDQVIVNVVAVPTANAGPDQITCAGTPVTLGGAPTGPTGATYLWDNGATLDDPTAANPIATPLVTTTYIVTVSTGVNCTATDQVTITVNPAVTANAGADQSICSGFGVTIGGVASGGTPNFTYSWSPAAGLSATNIAQPTANPTSTTTYTVTVTDANGCTDDDQVTVSVNSATADAGGNFSLCQGSTVVIGGTSNGTAPLTYNWDNAASLSASNIQNPTANPTVTTTYTLTVTDANGCTDTDQAIVTVNTPPVANAGADQSICPGASANIGAASQLGNTYAWTPSASLNNANISNPTATPTSTTTYTLTVTNTASGCTATDQVTITVNPSANADAGTDQSICLGQSIQIGGTSSGTAPLTYSWNNAASLSASNIQSPIATPSTTTTYTLTVTDANGCTDTDDVIVTVINNPTADAGSDQNICSGSSVTLGGSPTGPVGATYLWDNGASLSSTTIANPIATPTATTTYSVTVTSGAGCSAIDQVTITVDPLPTADAGADQTICNLQSVTIGGSPTSSTAGATFAWDNAASLNNSTAANPIANPSTTTTYTVTVTHPNGCTATDQMTVNVNALPTADAGADQFICDGGSVQIGGSPTGPTGASYAWSNAASLSSATAANPTANPIVTTTYTVTVTDGNGCTDTDQVTVTVGTLPTADAGADFSACADATVSIGGSPTGPAGSTFLWSPTTNLSSSTAANPTLTVTTTATYTVTVTDASGCTNTDQITVTAFPVIVPDAGGDQVICNGGSIVIGGTTTGGTAPLTYAWDNGASLNNPNIANPTANPTVTTTYTLTVTDANGCTQTDDVLVTVNSLPTANAGVDQTICNGFTALLGGPPGPIGTTYLWDNAASLNDATLANPTATPTVTTTYTLTVTDANGCSNTDQVTVTVVPIPDADAGADQTICENSSIQLGGSPTSSVVGATYAWDNAASLDNASLANPTATPLVTTTYTVTVSHPNGCTNTDAIVITVNPAPATDAGADQAICIGQSTAIGGSPTGPSGSTYAWDNAGSLNDATIANPTASPTVTTTYTVTVTDGNGCSNTDAVTITVNPLPAVDAGADQTICEGSSTSIGGSPTGPTGSTFAWDNAASLNDATLANPTANPTVTTTYTVTVTDANGCSDVDAVTITVDPLPNVDAGADQAICDLQSVTIGGSPTSTTVGATFAWDNAASLNDATIANPIASPNSTTTYTVTVTHPNGCTATDQVIVTVNPLPVADAGADQDICIGQSTAIGGSPTGPAGSTFAWDNSASLNDATLANPTASPTVTTTYTVTVTDGNGCTNTDAIVVTVNPLPNADAGADQSICLGQTVTLGGSPTSSTPGATFAWNNAASLNSASLANPIATPTTTTTYTVTVTDPNGCSSTDDVTITVNPIPNVSAGPDLSTCNGLAVSIGGAPTSTTPGVSYLWDNAASLNDATLANPVATPAVTTTYTVTVTDINGCTDNDAMTLTVNPLPTADAGADQQICQGNTATLGGSPTGPAGATYAWSNAASLSSSTTANPIASPTVTTTYTVTVTDGNGCSDVDDVTITVDPAPTADAGPDITICDLTSVTIGGSPTSTTVGATFSWSNAASLSSATAANPTANPSVTTTYTVTVTHPNGCTATDQMILTVNPRPTADAGLDRAICIGQSRVIGGSPTGPGGATYLWDNAASLDNATLANPTASPTTTTTYTVTVTDLNGCTNTDAVTITVNPRPTADAGNGPLFVCLLDSITLGGNPTSTAVNAFYAWNNPASLDDPTSANPKASPSANTTYTVTVTDQNGCTNTDQVLVVVNPLPNADAGPDQVICDGGSVQIGGSPTSTTPAVTYLWDNAATLSSATVSNPTASPTSTTVYRVRVRNSNGCVQIDSMTVVVNQLPVVEAGADSPICEGDTIILGGNPTGPAGSTYQWDNAASMDDPTLSNPRAFPTTTTVYNVTVTDANGCTGTDAILVTVNPAPTVDAGTDQVICLGDSTQIGGTPTGPSGSTFSWFPANGLSDPTVANPMASPDITTDYIVTISDGSSCSSRDTVRVTVNELPQVDFRVDATCFGDFAAFSDQTNLDSTAIQAWSWDFGDGVGSSVLQNPAYQYTTSGDFSVKLIVTSNRGCIDSTEKTITINALPIADAGPDISICEEDTIVLGGSMQAANINYNWSPGLGLSSVNEPNPQAYPLASTTYYLSVSDANGCLNYDTVDVVVNPLPNVVSTVDTFSCKGAPLQLNASGALTYLWQPISGLNDPQIANPIARPTRDTDYIVLGTDANGCINTDTTSVRVFNIDFNPRDTSICFGDSIGLSVEVFADDPSSVSYVWSPSNGLDNTNTASPMASPAITTKYQVRVRDSRGCADVDSLLLKVNTLPLVRFDYNVSARCEGGVLELTNLSSNTDNYIWKLNGIQRSDEYEADFGLDYSIENTISLLGSNASCSDSTFKTIPIMTFDEVFEFKDANVFTPNGDGVNDIFNPGFDGEFIDCAEFLVFDRWGDKMFDSNIGQYGWDGRSMKGGNAPIGTYFYIVRIADKEIRGSVYLQR